MICYIPQPPDATDWGLWHPKAADETHMTPTPSTLLRPVTPRPALVEQVAEQLRERIMGGEFPPGASLPPENTLASTLGVSRTVIREAMQNLRSQGLVEVSQGRPPRVREVGSDTVARGLETLVRRSQATLADLLEVRRPLEGEIAALAAARATAEQVAGMQEQIDALLAAGDLQGRIAADVRFHGLLAGASGNPLFGLLLATVAGPLSESRRRTISRTGARRAADGHARILARVRARDPEGARREMLTHLEMAGHDLRTRGR